MASVDCEAGEVNPYDSSSPPVVEENISNAHVGGTDPSLGPQAGPTTPAPSQQGGNASHMLKEQGLSSLKPESDPSSTGSKDPEDIPTFDEWKRKMMEVEKEKIQATHTSSNGGSSPVKKVQKNFNNYASVECGAKILGSNPEAKSTSAILMENMDMYMLNPCSNKIWFIIELCEPIQVKQLDIANFELFSSTPKDFLVSISDRYPTNKWLKLGTFHGRDERTVQSFPLDEHLYAKYVKMFTKYIKVELLSHFGSEHFCPLSLIRAFGTSMVEEYEDSAYPSERPDDPDDDFDYPGGHVPTEDKSSNNIIGSAKDVILNMVSNIAVNVLGGVPDQEGNVSSQALNETETPSPAETATTPLIPEAPRSGAPPGGGGEKHLHRQCSSALAAQRVYRPPERGLAPRHTLPPGWQLRVSPSACPTPPKPHTPYPHPQDQDQEPLPGQRESDISPTVVTPPAEEHTEMRGIEASSEPLLLEPSQTTAFLPPPSSVDPPAARPTPAVEEPAAPTKDLPQLPAVKSQDVSQSADSVRLAPTVSASLPSATVEPSWAPSAAERPSQEASLQDAPVPSQDEASPPPPVPDAPPATEPQQQQQPPPADPSETGINAPDSAPEQEASSSPPPDGKVEDLVEELLLAAPNGEGARPSSQPHSDIYAELHASAEQANGNGNQVHGSSQKESVFMRLNNRIKALEMNMSLSGRYLEQLSQRYRKQMEEMQRAFNTTIIKLQNTSRIAEEQDQRQTESIQALQGQLENVTQLVLNLSVRVSHLQSEVSDRQSYLLLCLVLGLLLGLLLCANHCRMSALPSPTDPEPPGRDSYSFYCPDRPFSPYEEVGLKRCASYPLMYSDSLQLPTTEDQDLANGGAPRHRSPLPLDPAALPTGPPHPGFRNPPSEGSSEGSSHSDDPSFCGLANACTRLCDGLPPPRSRADKRAFKRRRSKPSCAVVDLLQAPRRDQGETKPLPVLQDMMRGNKELRSGPLGVTAL
ncbi:SUN domain-containing ossification factor [Aplochiton taeniatus]